MVNLGPGVGGRGGGGGCLILSRSLWVFKIPKYATKVIGTVRYYFVCKDKRGGFIYLGHILIFICLITIYIKRHRLPTYSPM